MCGCGCKIKPADQGRVEETVRYYCPKCNNSKETKQAEPKPECCGKKMMEMD